MNPARFAFSVLLTGAACSLLSMGNLYAQPAAATEAAPAATAPLPETAPATAAAPATAPSLRLPPRPAQISRVVSELLEEAVASWSRNEAWPRTQCDYATRLNLALPSEDVTRLLTRRIHTNPTIDGYVKWQLLSFNPQLVPTDEKTIRALVATFPDLIGQPEPEMPKPGTTTPGTLSYGRHQSVMRNRLAQLQTGSTAPLVSLGGSGGAIGPQFTPPSPGLSPAASQANLLRMRKLVQEVNQPSLDYREMVVQLIPRADGVRIWAMIDDVKDRLVAGDTSYRPATDRLVKECREFAQEQASISPLWRPRIVGGLRELARLKTSVVQGIRAQGNDIVVEKHQYMVTDQDLISILGDLKMQTILN